MSTDRAVYHYNSICGVKTVTINVFMIPVIHINGKGLFTSHQPPWIFINSFQWKKVKTHKWKETFFPNNVFLTSVDGNLVLPMHGI